MVEFFSVNWALISIVATIAVLTAVPWLVLRKYVRIALHIVEDTIPSLSMVPRDFTRLEGEILAFRAFDGLRLEGMFLYGDEPRRESTVVFAHEFELVRHRVPLENVGERERVRHGIVTDYFCDTCSTPPCLTIRKLDTFLNDYEVEVLNVGLWHADGASCQPLD